MSKTITYTDPQLYDYGGDISRSWFIGFEISNSLTGVTIRKQFREGINYYHDSAERTRAGNELVKTWKDKLKAGWNPWAFIESTDTCWLALYIFVPFQMNRKNLFDFFYKINRYFHCISRCRRFQLILILP